MEPIAVNHVTITEALFAESHAAVFSEKRRKTLLYSGIVFLAAGAVLAAFRARLPAAGPLYLSLLLTGALVILWALTLRRSDLKKKYRVFRQKNGECAERTVICDRTGITVDSGAGEPSRIEYTDILEHRETEHLYLLLCRGHLGVQLAKNGFETGSWEALRQAEERAKQEAEALRELI